MSLLNVIVWICTTEVSLYFLAILIYTIVILAICFQAAYQSSDDFLREKVMRPAFAITTHIDYNKDLLETRAKCLHLLRECTNDIHKQIVVLSSRLAKKHSLVRKHCKTIVDILKEEIVCTEAQVKLIAQDGLVDSLVDSEFVEAQLSVVRAFVEELDKCLIPLPKPTTNKYGKTSRSLLRLS